ncbi:hypothetical protein HMPREF9093_01193 [Fusobacterium sp. oral taxon 370 str. F0437]|uniref:DUF4253 domain-containing protein n=1 Tax=Fusobacterium sp. oral taxon 370 TaxID=712288 RepID=UPI000234AD92|nr:DUF4253 domain-containing protein [Fusobacterium sp. oral taxon 370]EHI78541.1 hypothetical protein HMPREF9093_01193 [Fusobacterium sp. oral taxon 370 str. F0437]
MENIEEFKKLYNFEFEEIKADSFEEISKKYLAAYKDGKEKGYTAVFLTVDDYLLKAFEITMKDENTDNMMDIYNKNLERAKSINPNDLFNKFLKQNIDESFTEADFKFDDSIKNNLKFSTVFDRNEILKNNVILVKVPTKKPYEVLAYFGMGSEGIATVKYWYEKYGAVPAAITYDEIEFYVERPVQTLEEAKKLAIEQHAFCYGLLWECYNTLEELANAIYKNVQWYFWWS